MHAAALILLVDDDEDTRTAYAEALAEAGYRVANAVDGEHALWKAIATEPDLVVMDLAMPSLDGFGAIREIRSLPKTTHLPVIVVTGMALADSLQRAKELGAKRVLTKPCLPATLLAAIRECLDAGA